MKKEYLLLAAVIFTAGVIGGANITPRLTGSGYIRFIENSTPATINASNGQLNLNAGGSNQNVNLVPSGTGYVVGGNAAMGNWPVSPTLTFFQNSALSPSVAANYALLQTNAGTTIIGAPTGQNIQFRINNGASPDIAMMNATGLGVLNNSPSYALDTVGDTNTSGIYRKSGTAGVGTGSTITICTSGACATSCTLSFNGGIRTGGTCP